MTMGDGDDGYQNKVTGTLPGIITTWALTLREMERSPEVRSLRPAWPTW